MITRKMLENKIAECGIQCNILEFQNCDSDKEFKPYEFWFVFSFEDGHTKMLDPNYISDGEDDYLGGIVDDTDDLAEQDNLLDAVGYVKEAYERWTETGIMKR